MNTDELEYDLFPLRAPPRSRLERAGLTPRQERVFEAVALVVVGLFLAGWVYSAYTALTQGRPLAVARRVAANPSPTAFYMLDAALRQLATEERIFGESGAVRVVVQDPGDTLALPDTLTGGATLMLAPADSVAREAGAAAQGPATGAGARAGAGARTGAAGGAGGAGEDDAAFAPQPGIWNVLVGVRGAVRQVPGLAVISTVPLSAKRGGRIGSYLIGNWPYEEGGTPRTPAYAPPRGMVRVTPENQDLPVSEHLRLRHFLTKGQTDVWPKYALVVPKLLDKVELTIQELNATGTPVERIGVISGFRTPHYNAAGGETGGRGSLSRHMYGDALDFFVDNDGDGRMDDLNGDGRVDVGDARVIAAAAERVEQKHPTMVGGIGIYRPTGAHSGFVHLDTRGFRSRW